MSTDSGVDDFDKLVSKLDEYREEILNSEAAIRTALEENLNHGHGSGDQSDLLFALKLALKSGGLDENKSENIALTILNSILFYDGRLIEEIQKNELEDDILILLQELGTKYQVKVNRLQLKENQGSDFWSSIESDIIIRGPHDSKGIDYRITKDFNEEVKISTNVRSSLRLIDQLLYYHLRAMESLSTEGESLVNKELIESVQQKIDEIRALNEEHHARTED